MYCECWQVEEGLDKVDVADVFDTPSELMMLGDKTKRYTHKDIQKLQLDAKQYTHTQV